MNSTSSPEAKIEIRNVTMAYGSNEVLHGVNATVKKSEVFIIMGPSGGGKTTLLRAMIGLQKPAQGEIIIDGVDFWAANEVEQTKIRRRMGVLYRGGALWSSMTLAENVALPLEEYTELKAPEVADIVRLKLSLVGLAGSEESYPSEVSGGMRKRAGMARAMALDPDILFFDEPSASLDPVSSQRMDELILVLRESLGTTIVVVTHDLASIFATGDHAIFVDSETRTIRAEGHPKELRKDSKDPVLREFLSRSANPSGNKPEDSKTGGKP